MVLSREPNGYRGDFLSCYKRIRELWEDCDLTQRQIAAMLEMKQPQYYRYEQEFRDFPQISCFTLPIFSVTTDYNLNRTDKPR